MKRLLLALAGVALLASALAVPALPQASSPAVQIYVLDGSGAPQPVKIGTTNLPTVARAVAPVASTALEASHVICAAACTLYSGQITTGGTAGFLLIFDATSAPSDGAVTPKKCVTVAANTSVGMAAVTPLSFTTGAVVVFSSTGCFTKTASATAYFSFEGI